MKVSKEVWEKAVNKLRNGKRSVPPATIPSEFYLNIIKIVQIGKTVLDVGCGNQNLRLLLPDVVYFGLDAFTECEGNIMAKIEDDNIFDLVKPVDTIFALAVMDGVQDFDKAITNMKLIAKKNIIFLTGINIEPDEKHTLKLQLSDFRDRFTDWRETLCVQIKSNLYLLQYENR